jgi:hypothetical protein
MDTQIINDMTTLHRERCRILRCGISRQIWNAIRKWAKDKQNEGVLG